MRQQWPLTAHVIYRAELGLEVEYRQHSTKTNKLANHHTQLQYLRVAVMVFEPSKKVIIHIVMVSGQSIGVFQRQLLIFSKSL